MVDPILTDIEQARKWGSHPKIGTGGQYDLTPDEANDMALDADFVVMDALSDYDPEPTDNNFRLKSLAATYVCASMFAAIFRDPADVQKSVDLMNMAKLFIERARAGGGTSGTGDSPAFQVLTNKSKNYRVNPDYMPYKSVF